MTRPTTLRAQPHARDLEVRDMKQEPNVRRSGKYSDMPSAEWMKWYRSVTGCSLTESLWAGQRKLRELEENKS